MATTYEPIATTTLTSAQSSVTFSSIPTDGTYTDLVLIVNGTASSEASGQVRFNSDSGTNYSWTLLDGAPASSRGTNFTRALIGNTYTQPYMNIVHIINYANTTTYKTLISRGAYQGSGTYSVSAWVSLWRSTSAINTLLVGPDVGTMSAGTMVTLYGIKAA